MSEVNRKCNSGRTTKFIQSDPKATELARAAQGVFVRHHGGRERTSGAWSIEFQTVAWSKTKPHASHVDTGQNQRTQRMAAA
jgi:hypothetical protein